MAIQLNHTIVWCRDQQRSTTFLTDLFGFDEATRFGPFLDIELANDATLAYHETDGEIAPQHYAFLVSDDEFDMIFERMHERGLEFWADPAQRRAGEINHDDGGRGVYFADPDGHLLELITRPYGSGTAAGEETE